MNSQEITDYQYFLASPFFAELVDFDSPDTKVFIKSFCELSIPLRDFLSSPDIAAVIISLGDKYGLQEKQISILSKIIKDLVFGKIFIKDLPLNISANLGIDEIKASQLVNDLVSQSFGPILEDIKRIQRTKFPERINQMKSAPQPPPLQARPVMPPQPIRQAQGEPSFSRPPLVMPPKPIQQVVPQQAYRPQPESRTSEPLRGLPTESRQSEVSLPGKPISPLPPPPQKPVNKPLEDELEKVASIIDLRNKPRE